MSVRRVQFRRGTTAENDAFTGAVAEITVDTQTNTVRVHDGVNAGGQDLLRTDMANNESITTNINVTGSITIGPDLGANTITIGEATSTISIPGTLNVTTQNTVNDLLIQDKVIVLSDGSEGNAHADDSIGLIFTRPLSAGGAAQDPGLIYWDEVFNRFVISTNNVDETDAVWNAGGTPTAILIGALDLNEGNITNVGSIALDTISADGNTIAISLKQAGLGSAFSIVDDNAVTHLTIDATNGSEKLIIDSPTFEVDAGTATSILGSVVINDGGVDKDFRVEGVGKTNALFVQGSDGFVGINNGAPTAQFEITGNSILDGSVSLNTSRADVDFNVAASNAGGIINALFVQGSDGFVGINNGAPSFNLDVIGTSGFSSTARFSGDVDLRTHIGPNNGITFNKGIANDTTNAKLLRVDRAGSFSSLTWDATNHRFVLDTDLQISSGGLLMGGVNSSVSVPTNGAGAGFSLTLSSGVGDNAGANDGSLILRSGTTNVLTLDTDELATFAGNIAVPDAGVIGSNIVNAQSLQLGNDVGSTTYVRGILKVGADNISSSGGTQALALSGANVEAKGNLKVTGNIVQQNGALNATETVMTFSGDANKIVTFAGGVSSTTNISTEADLVVKGGDITLGKENGADTSISVPTTNQGGAGWAMTLSSGVGSVGNGTDDGSIILRTGTTAVLTLDTDELATFTGDIDLTKASPTIGASVGNGETLTLGAAGSVVATSGDLRVNGNDIQDSAGTASITFSGNSATTTLTATTTILSGDLRINGNDILSGDGTTTITMANDGSLVTVGADLKVSGNGIQDSAGTESITFSGNSATTTLTATTTILSGDLRIQGGNIISPDGNSTSITIDNDDNVTVTGDLQVTGNDIKQSTGDAVITFSGDVNKNTTLAGDLQITGNDIKDSGGNTTVTFAGDASLTTLTATLVTVTGDLKIGGNTVQASDGSDAIELSGANATVKGDLTVEGRDIIIGTATGGDASVSVPTQTTANTAGHDLTISAGAGDGTGAGGSLVFKTAPAGLDGGGANAVETALTIDDAKLATFAGSVTISGDLTVNGNSTTVNTATLDVEDTVIRLNKGIAGAANSNDIGLYLERGTTGDSAVFFWDEDDDKFKLGTTTGNSTATDFTNVTTLGTLAVATLESSVNVAANGGITVDGDKFAVTAAGVLTTLNTAEIKKTSETALTVKQDGGTSVLTVDTTNSNVETLHIVPAADSTWSIGTDGLRYSNGYFDTVTTTDLTLTNAPTLNGATLTADIDIQKGAQINFRSDAGNPDAGDQVLISVNEGNGTSSTISWDTSYDGFTVSSKTNVTGDFTVGSVDGVKTFTVASASGDLTVNGNIDSDDNEAKSIFTSVTDDITIGNAAGRLIAGNTFSVTGSAGIGDTSPGTALQVSKAEPYVTLKNTTAENNDGGAESRLIFEDHSDTALVQIESSHEGVADDTKGQFKISTNSGAGLVDALSIASTGKVSITQSGADLITLNSAFGGVNNTNNAGLTVKRGSGDTANAALFYDEGAGNTWKINRGEGVGSETVLTENDTLFIIDADGDADTITVKQGSGQTITFVGNSGASNAGIEFVIDPGTNTVQAVFESTVKLPGDLTLTAGGATGSIDCYNLTVSNDAVLNGAIVKMKDPLLFLGLGNTGAGNNAKDLGFYGLYPDSDNANANRFAGLIYDVSTNVWKLFDQDTGANTNGEDSTLDIADSELASVDLKTVTATTKINVKSPSVAAAITPITLNSDQAGVPDAAEDVTIEVERGDSNNAKITWDEGNDRWTLDQGDTNTYAIVTVKASEGSRYECASPAFAANAVSISAPSAVENKHAYFLSNGATAGTVNLFDLTAGYDGYVLQIFNTGTNTLTVDGSGAQTVDGVATKDIAQGASLTLMSYGTAWYVI